MNRFARYAIYYMPDPSGSFWSAGSSWLGRDAISGQTLPRPTLPGLADINADRLTAGPRRYGFHGTLKAPFAAAYDGAENELLVALDAFAASRCPFEVRMEVASLRDFIALRLTEPSDPMTALHRDCVCVFDRFRLPISDGDLARRQRGRLTPDQDAYLLRWGYPYIFDQFHFHMTLTSRITSKATKVRIVEALAELFAPHLAAPHRVDGIALFGQPALDEPFQVLDWFPLRGAPTSAEHGAQA